ncbi:MAG: ABC transporter ATP-binding protein/permease [Bacteroidales bacterium]|nr:ABC transporter ATP-binding protein/permease [Bacteroidales bacterium]
MKEFWKVIKRYVAPYKGYLGGSILMNILSALLNIFSFSMLAPILKILFESGSTEYKLIPWSEVSVFDFNSVLNNIYYYMTEWITQYGASRILFILCAFFCVVTLFKSACCFGAEAMMIPIRTGVVKTMRMQIYQKVISLPLGFFSQERKGDIMARISGDVQEVEFSITSTLDMLLKNPILIIFYFGWLLVMSWQMTLFVIVFAPLFLLIMSAIGRRLKADSAEAQQFWSDTMSQVEETLGGLRIIKAFRAEKKMSGRFEKTTENMRRKNTQVGVRQASAHPVSELLGTIMIAVVLWFGGRLILGDSAVLDAPAFIAYLAILYSVIQPIKDLSKAAYGIPKGLASMERIDVILNAENNVRESENPQRLDGFNDRISFEHVSFRYGDGSRDVVKDITIDIPKGRTIAIVGASGAGKSTLVDLIPRFYDPTAGRITIDGVDIKDARVHDLRALMGNVNQDPILFNDTLFNNIAFGVENATREEVIAAARIANAHDFIMEKEEGYDTSIGDRGVKLSGGQRQRISIARAILKNPPILILDEATASLDTESERIVQDALDHLMSSRTTIAIAHRLSTIKNADEILVMNEGEIVERGRHDELIEKNGYYKKLYDMQAL